MEKALDKKTWILSALAVALFCGVHALAWQTGEPAFNNDENRHLMTGVFFRDFYHDLPIANPRGYAIEYYLRYPALGLLVWPPAFYALEGLFMLCFGISFAVGKILVLLFAAASLVYQFRLARTAFGSRVAAVSTLFLAVSPLFFKFSQHVMLEVPTLAAALGSLFHFDRHLRQGKRADLIFAAALLALALLTRFDAVFLAPGFLFLAALHKRSGALFRKETLIALVCCLAAVAPAYFATFSQFGHAHLQAVRTGTAPGSTHFMALANLVYYPAAIPEQIGWALTAAALAGAIVVAAGRRWTAFRPYLALAAATYLTFTPMAELGTRHTLYWVPCLVTLAALGIEELAARSRSMSLLAGLLCLASTAYATWKEWPEYVFGYEDAARFVVENTRDSRYCLFDNFLNGDFIFQVRKHDPARRLGILRGDKLFYGVLSEPYAAYKELAGGEKDILDGIYRYDPEFIVVESPQVRFVMPMATELRRVLSGRPDRFRLVREIPLRTDLKGYTGVSLLIYRNLVRNPHPEPLRSLEMVGMGTTLRAPAP